MIFKWNGSSLLGEVRIIRIIEEGKAFIVDKKVLSYGIISLYIGETYKLIIH